MSLTAIELNDAAHRLQTIGPHRVYDADRREGVHPRDAGPWDLALIRNDGWSLGCTWRDAQEAFNLWPEAWTHVVERPKREPPQPWVPEPVNAWLARHYDIFPEPVNDVEGR